MKNKTFKGTVSGVITTERHGKNGFGYDQYFCPELNKTMAEITNDEKGKISHRGNAIRLLKEYLEGEQHVYGIILSDNHKETGILYHIYELHKDADKFYI